MCLSIGKVNRSTAADPPVSDFSPIYPIRDSQAVWTGGPLYTQPGTLQLYGPADPYIPNQGLSSCMDRRTPIYPARDSQAVWTGGPLYTQPGTPKLYGPADQAPSGRVRYFCDRPYSRHTYNLRQHQMTNRLYLLELKLSLSHWGGGYIRK